MSEGNGVKFVEAIAYLRDRLNFSESEWQALLRAAGARAGAAVDAQAEAMRRDLLAAATEIFEAGGTSRDFAARYTEISARHGWASAGDPGWHSNLIWRMESFGARAAGRWEQAWRLQRARPNVRYYFRYITAGDHRVRDTHRSWQGVILPIGHPFWRTHFPPNGFNCRCHVTILTDRDLVRYGWTVTGDADPRLGVPPDPGFAVNPGLAWQELRGTAPELAPALQVTTTPAAVAELLSRAETMAPRTRIELAQAPFGLAERLGGVEVSVGMSAETVARHRHHGEADAAAYSEVLPRLLALGQFFPDPDRSNHGRLIGEVNGQVWAAVVKADAGGRLWLVSLHRSNLRQMRRWMGGR